MFNQHGVKLMLDLHGLSVKEVKKVLEEHFAKIKEQNIFEFYLITGRGNHVNSNGSRGVLKKALPKLLKPYCQDIIQINPEAGAYKIILNSHEKLFDLKNLLSSILVDKNEEINFKIEFINSLKEEIGKNDITSILALAAVYLYQPIEIEGYADINEGIALLLKAKELGSLDAYVHLGILYHEGIIVTQNHQEAFKLFQYAANKGDPIAQYYLAVCYLHGKGVKYSKVNDEKAVFWMKKSADQNDVYAQATVSDFYLLGKITSQNIKLGIFYKTKAAEQGFVEAQIDLARLYGAGYSGIKQDYQIAFNLYLSASEFNHAYALYQVGFYLLAGRCGIPNPAKAFPYFLKAAELGDADGQAQVGWMMTDEEYIKNKEIPHNLPLGIQWLKKAKAQNHKGAIQLLEEFENKYKPVIDFIKTAFGDKYNQSVTWEIHTTQNDIYAKVNKNFSFEKDAKLYAEKLHALGLTKAFAKQAEIGKGWTLIVPNLEDILKEIFCEMKEYLEISTTLNKNS